MMSGQPRDSLRRRRGFEQQIGRNRWRLRLALVAYFLLALAAGQLTGRAFLFIAGPDEYYAQHFETGIDGGNGTGSELFDYVNQVTLAVLLLAWVEYRRMHRRGDAILLGLVDARPLKEQQLVNTGAEMAIAAGLLAPRMWIIESPDLNAFSCARAHGAATIALTRGLLERLPREQIQAVVGHEVAHIRNGDARLMTLMLGMGRAFHLVSAFALGPLRALFDAHRLGNADDAQTEAAAAENEKTPHRPSFWDRPLTWCRGLVAILATPVVALAVMAVGVALSLALVFAFGMVILLFPWLVAGFAVWELARDRVPAIRAWLERRASQERVSWSVLLIFVPVGLVSGPAILVLGVLVPIMLALMRLVVSRNREYQADATAVRLTRNPGALRRALETIRGARSRPFDTSSLPGALSPITIVSASRWWDDVPGLNWLLGLLSTHPPLEARISRLADMEFSAQAEP